MRARGRGRQRLERGFQGPIRQHLDHKSLSTRCLSSRQKLGLVAELLFGFPLPLRMASRPVDWIAATIWDGAAAGVSESLDVVLDGRVCLYTGAVSRIPVPSTETSWSWRLASTRRIPTTHTHERSRVNQPCKFLPGSSCSDFDTLSMHPWHSRGTANNVWLRQGAEC